MIHEIKVDKRKQIAGMILSLLFIAGVIVFWMDPAILGESPFREEALFAIMLTILVIFAALFFFLFYKIRTKQFGLIINCMSSDKTELFDLKNKIEFCLI